MPPPAVTAPIAPSAPKFTDHKWHRATFRQAAAGRYGGYIRPWSVVVHTTDMLPNTFGPLIRNWTSQPGNGACAHFCIDRDGSTVQLIPINRNGHHAGKGGHFLVKNRVTHPNAVCIGIEVHAAGHVRKIDGKWFYEDGTKLKLLPDDEVTPDPRRPDRGWHGPTAAQFETLDALLTDLHVVMDPVPDNVVTVPSEEPGGVPQWGRTSQVRVIGHVTLDPARKTDPGVPGMSWVTEWAKRNIT